MNPAEVTMLVGGIVLFVAALVLLFYCVAKGRSFKPVLVLFAIAIIMIGFPSIKSLRVPGVEVNLADTFKAFKDNPDNPTARDNLDRVLDNSLSAGPAKGLTPEARSNLETVVSEVDRRGRLSPATRMTLSKAQLLLGQTNAATTNLHFAVRQNTNLIVDPKLRFLLKRPIR